MQNITHKTEEGLNKIVNKAKKVFVKDEIIAEDNLSNREHETAKNSTENYRSSPIKSSEEFETNEIKENKTSDAGKSRDIGTKDSIEK